MYSIVIVILVFLAFLVAGLLHYFGDYRKLPWYTQVVAFLAWLFPFSLPVILPLDLASTHYRKCLDDQNTIICDRPLAYVSDGFLLTFWKTVYWTMFCLTWFTIPLMQAWVRAGEFRLGRRLWAALRENLVYYGSLGAVGICFLLYTLVVMHITKDTLLGMGIAAANAWGLLLVTVMMGYGMVEVPRTLWYDANTAWSLRYMEFTVPRVKESMVDAEADLYDISREIAVAAQKVPFGDPLRPLVDRLMEKCPLALEERNIDQEEVPAAVTENHLIDLHARIKRAVKVNERTQAQYYFLLQKAFLYQDILESHRNKDKKFVSPFLKVKEDQFKDLKLRLYWYWYVWIRPVAFRCLSVVAVLASLALIWSESTFQFEGVTLSVPAVILKSPYIGYVALELVSMGFILYMCTCAYSTLFKIKYFDYYLVPEHHTDEGSLMWVGSYLCKLTFPLCYNFLNIVTDETSMFTRYQGSAVNLTPLLGDGYNKWLPEIVLIFALITFCNLHGRILRLFNIKHYSYFEAIAPNDEDIDEGKGIIDQARAIEERKRSGPQGDSRFSSDFSSIGRPIRSNAPRATNTKDLLAKYKSGQRYAARNTDSGITAPSAASSQQAAPKEGGTGLWNFKRGTPFKGMFSGSSAATVGGGAGKFQRLEEDVESGRGEFGSGESLDMGGKSGRKFGVASSQRETADAGGGVWDGFANSRSGATSDDGATGAGSRQTPSSNTRGNARNIFADI